MWFRAEADATSALDYARRGTLKLSGKMHAEGLADEVPTAGHMEVQPLSRRIGYELEFRGDDGQLYRFVGEKTLRLTRLVFSMTTLPGDVLASDGRRVGTARLHFDLRNDILPFLTTFRRARSERALAAEGADA